MTDFMEGAWAQTILNQGALAFLGWTDPDQIIGLASIIKPPGHGCPYNLLHAARALDSRGIPVQSKATLNKCVAEDPITGRLIYTPYSQTSAQTDKNRATSALAPLRTSNQVISWGNERIEKQSDIYPFEYQVLAYWCDINGTHFYPELIGATSSDTSTGTLVPPATRDSLNQTLLALMSYGGHNTANQNEFGATTRAQLPIPSHVRERQASAQFNKEHVDQISSKSNQGRVRHAEQVIKRLQTIFHSGLYAVNEGINEQRETAGELRDLFTAIKSAPTIEALQHCMHLSFGELYEDAPTDYTPNRADGVYRCDFTRLYEAGVFQDEDVNAAFTGSQSINSIRYLVQLIRGELRFQYEEAFSLVYPEHPRFLAETERHSLVPSGRHTHAAEHAKATAALQKGLPSKPKGNTPRQPPGRGGRGGGRGRGRSNRGQQYTAGRRREQKTSNTTEGGGNAEETINISAEDPPASNTRGGGRGRGRGRGRGSGG